MTRILFLFTAFFSLSLIPISKVAADPAVDHPMVSMEGAFDCLRNVAPEGSCTEEPLTYVSEIQQASIEGRFAVSKMVENGGPVNDDEVTRIFNLFDVLLLNLNDTITTGDVEGRKSMIQQIIALTNEAHASFQVAPVD